MTKTKKLALMSLMVTLGLVLSIIENALPLPMIAPGAKIGLANIITMVTIVMLTPVETFTVLMLRILLASIFTGGFSGFLYSLTGGVLSFIMMLIVKKTLGNRVSMVGISVTGAYFHSFGQVLAAAIILQNMRMMSYLPVLLGVSIFAGIFIGLVAENLLKFKIVKEIF